MEEVNVVEEVNETEDELKADESAALEKKSEKLQLRSIVDIVNDLKKPIHPSKLETRKQGGANITYLPWRNCVRYLDLYATGWSYTIPNVYFDSKDRVVVVAELQIPCLEGVVIRQATGTEEEPAEGKKMYGDKVSNAESMALRRAAAKAGLALYLYDK